MRSFILAVQARWTGSFGSLKTKSFVPPIPRFALSARRKNPPAKSFVLRAYKVYKNKGL